MARTEERQAQFDFTHIFDPARQRCRAQGRARIRSTDDRDKTVVVMKETVRRNTSAGSGSATGWPPPIPGRSAAPTGQREAQHPTPRSLQTLAAENLIHTLGLANLELVGPPLARYHDFCFAVQGRSRTARRTQRRIVGDHRRRDPGASARKMDRADAERKVWNEISRWSGQRWGQCCVQA